MWQGRTILVCESYTKVWFLLKDSKTELLYRKQQKRQAINLHLEYLKCKESMKKFNNLSIKVKLPLLVGSTSFLVMTAVCLLLLVLLRSGSLESSSEIARLSAMEAGQHLTEKVNNAASVVRAYSGVVTKIISSDIVSNHRKRELILAEIEPLVLNEKSLHNIWCSFEPDVIDGLDSIFVDRMGSNSQGRFSPWFTAGQVVSMENNENYEFYSRTREVRGEIITEPYLYNDATGKNAWYFSICVPVIINGRFIGAVGTDFRVDEFNHLLNGLKLSATGKLVTNKGTIALHQDLSQIGTLAENGNRKILDQLPVGKMIEGMFPFEGKEMYHVYIPVQLGENTEPWFYSIRVPKEEIYEQARQTAGFLIVYCLIGVVFITFAGWFVIRAMLKGVIDVTGIIHQLSFGRINFHIEEARSQDEIGKMKTQLAYLVKGLQRTSSFAHEIGEGRLDAAYQPLSEEDVLGNSLLEMRCSLQKANNDEIDRKIEEEHRNWRTSGLAKFAEILRRDNNDIEALSYNVISNLVKYLEVNQGGIFILNDEGYDKILEMKACYAFDRKKFAEKQVLPGEGLVGLCYLEGESIYLTDIPDKYITITSGLGDDNPRALFICPLKVNGKIYGIIELASFREFEPYQLEFIEKVSESIAATIATVRVSLRTERLLEQTKLQAEELANQEEELRQNMEEMQTTQEEMKRREADMLETLNEMERLQNISMEKDSEMQQLYQSVFESFNMVEFSPDAIITDINQQMISSFEDADKDHFIGQHLTTFIKEEAMQEAWHNVSRGKPYEDVQQVTVGKDKSIMFKQKFIPICDHDENLKRVLLMAYPVGAEQIN